MSTHAIDQTFLSGLTVLLVEDNPTVQRLVSLYLRAQVGRLCLANDGAEGLEQFRRERPDIIVTDLLMPILDGLAMIEAIRAEAPGIPVIVSSGLDQASVLLQAITLGVDRYLMKPLQPDQLSAALLHCSHNLRLARGLELHRQKADLLQAQHEETLGILAGGMAHDYNNLLQSLMLMVSLAKQSLNDPDEALELLTTAESAWTEIRELGTRLMFLSQKRVSLQDSYSLESVLSAAWDESVGNSHCSLDIHFAGELPAARFNLIEMKTVIKMLIKNALEAMGGSGALSIEGRIRAVSLPDPVPLAEGDYLQLSFTDQGPGIAPTILPIMFSPYASTKERGSKRGTGLSLALAQAVMKLHGGAILAENVQGGGAALHLYLPLADPRGRSAATHALKIHALHPRPSSDKSLSA